MTGDGGVQVHRGQGCVPKVLQQDACQETGKELCKHDMLNKTTHVCKNISRLSMVILLCLTPLSQVQHMSASDDAEASMISKLKQVKSMDIVNEAF